MNFKKEIDEMIMVEDISDCFVKGSFEFITSSFIRFNLDVEVELNLITSDTLKLIKYPLSFKIQDEVSDTSETEYKIINNQIDFYELVWGWLVTEIPNNIYEK